jgi:exonuclease SbcC
MRPSRLTMSGFGPFRDEVVLDFDDADFFALVGPTGAGKSSVIDAISFALYGSVPRHGERDITPIASVGANEAQVALEFTVGGDRYTALRGLRRNARTGRYAQRDPRLERHLDDGGVEALVDRARDMDAAIERLVGLPFADFCKCVAIPQGEFQRFLHEQPRNRQDMLVRLLGLEIYGRVARRAGDLGTGCRAEADTLDGRLAELAGATPEALAAAQAHVEALAAVLADVAAAISGDEALAQEQRDAEEEARRRGEAARALTALAEPEGIADLSDEIARADGAAERAAGAAAATGAALRAAQEACQALPDLAPLLLAQTAHRDLASLTNQAETIAGEQAAAGDARRRTAEQVASARAAAEAADARHEELRAAHASHALSAELVVGEPCPVCDQVVARLPVRVSPAEVEEAAARRREARQQLDRATAAHADAERTLATLEERARGVAEQRARAEALVAEHADAAALAALVTRVEEAHAARDDAAKADQEARDGVEAAQRAVAALADRRAASRSALGRARDAFAARGPPPLDTADADLAGAWRALVAWAGETGRTEAGAAEQAAEAARAVAARRAEVFESCTQRARAAGAGEIAAPSIGELHTALVRASADAEHAVATIAAAIAKATELRARVAALREEAALAEQLAQLLSARGFEAWLVEEALETLLAGASEILFELSRGAYSLGLDDQRSFTVVDHRNADERRSVRTLSGGETFQASLALALALSDQLRALAAGGAPPIEALFLDEGFGTLDADSLDVVAATIENLGARGRMVGIVTHVRELAERVPVRFEVRKAGRTSTVERIA